MFASRMPSRFAVSDDTFRSSSTPTTVSHSLPTLIARPIGSSVVKKRDFTPCPMIATCARRREMLAGERRAFGEVEVHHAEVARVDADDLAGSVMPFARDARC